MVPSNLGWFLWVRCLLKNFGLEKLELGKNLTELLCISQVYSYLLYMTFVKRCQSPTTYFIHCSLLDKKQNLLNEKPSTFFTNF